MLRVSNYSIIQLIKKIFLHVLLVFLFACQNDKQNSFDDIIFNVDAEHFTDSSIVCNSDIYQFTGNKYLTTKESHSGKYSVFADSSVEFLLSTEISLPKDFYSLSFWKKGNANILAVVQGIEKEYYQSSNAVVSADSSGWQKVRLIFEIPDSIANEKLKIYLWKPSKQQVFVDDFILEKYTSRSLSKKDTIFWIYVGDKEMQKLQEQRQQALKKGLLITEVKKWVKAVVMYGDENYKTKIRLKGDWTDHLYGKKWSFRIKIKNDAAFKRMKIFSVQNPSVRHFLDQWLLYTLLRDQGLLAPRYGFVYGQINNDFVGIYAYEEHFEKQLVESALRREGPILKFTEDAFWDLIVAHNNYNKWYKYPLFEAAKIEPFNRKKTLKNNTLYQEYLIAQNLLYQHKFGLTKMSDIFDIDKSAKFYALINVMEGYHGLRWHNMRYYYNPITSKLEFVSYDNFVGGGVYKIAGDRVIFGYFEQNGIPNKPEVIPNYYLFQDSAFVQRYIFYLKKYSEKSFWDSVFVKYAPQINKYEQMLIDEYGQTAIFDKKRYYTSAYKIKKQLPDYIEAVNNGLYDNITMPVQQHDFYDNRDSVLPEIIPEYVNVYTQSEKDAQKTIRIVNFFDADLKITGYGKNGNKTSIVPETLPSYQANDNFILLNIDKDAEYIFIKYKDKKYKIDILPWPEPVAWSPRQELEQNNKFPNESYYKVTGKNVVFSGKIKIDKIILIPSGYKVIFKAGTEIDFVNGGAFLSYSSVYINGTDQNPVIFKSSDATSRGFTVLNGGEVVMDYAIFDGLNTFSYKGWQLSGGVTIYETLTKITHSKFINNLCEDDLNIVRSDFDVRHTTFANTFSDGFDSDFCTGKVDSCYFENLGNDAIDFSTSKIDISNCTIKNATDKAVSGGEASHLTVKNCEIDGANIGIASKDLTVVEADNCHIKNATYVLTAFRKKPEYGEAKLIINNLKAEDYAQLSLIEKNSVLIMDNLTIEGKYKDVAKKFY